MAQILSDRQLARLLNTCILNASAESIKSNSYELRLGNHVRFMSTAEEKEVLQGQFVEIPPGEFVTISSLERIDFRKDTVSQVLADSMLMGLITPTTTMMREGFLFAATKIDAGFCGVLNWGIRNSTINPIVLKHGEKLFKLTIFKLDEDEIPEVPYGGRETDYYQDAEGITRSARMLPADIPEKLLVQRTERKIDPTRQLQEAGYPFSHIGTELINLQGKFEVVSTDVRLLKDEFQKLDTSLSNKIEKETTTLSGKVNGLGDSLAKKLEELFDKKFGTLFESKMGRIYGMFAALIVYGFGLYQFLLKSTPSSALGYIFVGIGTLVLVFTLFATKR